MDVFKVGLEYFKEMTVKERLKVLGEVIQKKKDMPYEAVDYECKPMFKKGQKVLVCSVVYYSAVILEVSEEYCKDLQKLIPCYKVRYSGWKRGEVGRYWVNEYDLSGLALEDSFAIVDQLTAHYWNVLLLEIEKISISNVKKVGIFKLDAEVIKELESTWRGHCGANEETRDWAFKKWIGFE